MNGLREGYKKSIQPVLLWDKSRLNDEVKEREKEREGVDCKSKINKRARNWRRERQHGEHLWPAAAAAISGQRMRPMGAARARAQQQHSEWSCARVHL